MIYGNQIRTTHDKSNPILIVPTQFQGLVSNIYYSCFCFSVEVVSTRETVLV